MTVCEVSWEGWKRIGGRKMALPNSSSAEAMKENLQTSPVASESTHMWTQTKIIIFFAECLGQCQFLTCVDRVLCDIFQVE